MVSIDKPNKKEEQASARKVPRLQNGDRLTRSEFERRYNAMPNTKKAELIERVVYIPSPVSHKDHSRPHSQIMALLGIYFLETDVVDLGDNATVRLDLDNEPQPDILLRIQKSAGGSSIVDEDGYIQGSPELVVEIAHSSASYDMHDKLNAYRRNGVQEYIVWLVDEEKIHWYSLSEDSYQPLPSGENGTVKSQVFPGLWLNIKAILDGELKSARQIVHDGLQSPEYLSFVAQFQEKSKE